MLRKVKVQALLATAGGGTASGGWTFQPTESYRSLPGLPSLIPASFSTSDGSLKNINELDVDTAAAIAGIEIFRGSKIPSKSKEARR